MPPSFERYIQRVYDKVRVTEWCIPPSFERYIQRISLASLSPGGCIPPSFERYIQLLSLPIYVVWGCIPPSFERSVQIGGINCRKAKATSLAEQIKSKTSAQKPPNSSPNSALIHCQYEREKTPI